MSGGNPLVSIIVRTKDRPKLLKRAIQSIANQTYRTVEVVLVNDGGCDLDVGEMKTILGGLWLNYIRLEKNTGRAHAGNVGIENAKGEYIGFLDDDDELYPDHIFTLLSIFSDGVNCSGAYSDSEIVQRDYDEEGRIITEDNKGIFRSYDFSYEVLLFENYIPLICCLLKKDYLRISGGFDESLEMFEDWDLFIRLSESPPFCHIKKITTKYIQWSKVHQIAFVNAPVAEENYLKVLSKHSDKMTPEVSYRYFLVKQEEMSKTVDIFREEIAREKEALSGAHALLEAVHSKNRDVEHKIREVDVANLQLREKVTLAEAKSHEVNDRLKDTERKNTELIERLKESDIKNEELKNSLKEMQTLVTALSSKNTNIDHKLNQIQDLQKELRDRQAQMQKLQEELRDRQTRMQKLQEELRDRQTQMQGLQEELRYKQIQVQELKEELGKKRDYTHTLEEELQHKEEELQHKEEELQRKEEGILRFQEELRDKQVKLQELQQQLWEKHSSSKEFHEALRDKQAIIHELQAELREKQGRLQKLNEEVFKKTLYIDEVQTGIGWLILEYYRRKIRDRSMPPGTKRRKGYDSFFKRIKSKKIPGIPSVKSKPSPIIKHEQFVVPKLNENAMLMTGTKVSVIIPTRNAGSEFQHVLEKIRAQKGIGEIEVIVVDSGSEDDTLALAKRYQAKIYPIDPSEFGHGKTRNYGARFASSEYLIFLSQDAIPIGDACFSGMIQGMKHDNKIAAVSARQIPRSDADLFACWQIWNHYEKFLKYPGDEVISLNRKDMDLLEPYEKRRIAQIDNICSCMRRDIFKKFMFTDLKYAEDLDLGLRLIKNGYKIGFLSSVGAIHSHNRNLLYNFKRSYIDRKELIRLLGIEPVNWHAIGIDSFQGMIKYVHSTFSKLDNILQALTRGETTANYETTLVDSLRHLVGACSFGSNNGVGKDTSLHSALDELLSMAGVNGDDCVIYKDIIMQHFLSTLENFKEYMELYAVVDDKCGEILSTVYKLCAVVIGANVGDYMAYSETGNNENLQSQVDILFGGGV